VKENERPLRLSARYSEALAYAAEKHDGQPRKGTRTPYLAHPLAVSSLVLENGGSENEAIAALLHDVPEDCGGRPALEEIRRRFGDEVAEIVEDCSDTLEVDKPDWKQRKLRYLAHLPSAKRSVRLVSAADKLHNARAILADYRTDGEKLWERFKKSGREVLWYYRELVRAFRQGEPSPLVDELDRVVSEIERLASLADPD
jgi:(p)ppGpp synthase/HD superfamily hydrolase